MTACWLGGPAVALLAAVVSVPLAGCSDTCGNSVVSHADAPDGRYSAVLFQRDCGATTGFSSQISILARGTSPIGGGNAFRADDDHGAARDGEWGGPWVDMKWQSSNRLLVRYAAKSRLFQQSDRVSGVDIIYQVVGS